ncbi:MAG: hypothetical protein HLUCCO02_10660 [Idiomarinaceae bacterium HL-53]|nr:MAG: hypothetical protein HLUCCO02_10660 [Idiomarinaceae bacterium HL-53]
MNIILVIRNAGQNVTIDSIGSGDATAMGVKGNFVVVSKGSGDARASQVDGETLVPDR